MTGYYFNGYPLRLSYTNYICAGYPCGTNSSTRSKTAKRDASSLYESARAILRYVRLIVQWIRQEASDQEIRG